MDPQSPLVHDGVGPGAGDQLILSDRLAGAFNKRYKDVQGPAAEAQRFPVLEQHALSRYQAERPEGEGFFIHRRSVLKNFRFIHSAENFGKRDSKLPGRSAAIPMPANSCKVDSSTISQPLTRPAQRPRQIAAHQPNRGAHDEHEYRRRARPLRPKPASGSKSNERGG